MDRDFTGLAPDGVRLAPGSLELAPHLPVHLRLAPVAPRQPGWPSYPVGACGGGLGEWWSGVLAEVSCRACLEVWSRV